MDTNHTPGPWELHPNSFQKAFPFVIQHPTGIFDIAMVCDCSTDLSEVAANAKLIAAAPDLLKVVNQIISLQSLIEYPNDVKEEHRIEGEAISELLSQARAAIKKATQPKDDASDHRDDAARYLTGGNV